MMIENLIYLIVMVFFTYFYFKIEKISTKQELSIKDLKELCKENFMDVRYDIENNRKENKIMQGSIKSEVIFNIKKINTELPIPKTMSNERYLEIYKQRQEYWKNRFQEQHIENIAPGSFDITQKFE